MVMMRDHLRFAMVTTFYPPYHFGGDAEHVRLLSHALARRGHHVEVIHDVDAFRMLKPGVEPELLPEPEGVRIHGLSSRLGALSCLATQQLGRPLVHGGTIQGILRQGFDVIHFHNISLVGGPGVLAYGDGIKLYTSHEHWLVCPSHILWRHGRELCTGRQCVRCVLRHHRPPQLWRTMGMLQKQSQHIDAFCALSRFSAAKHREFGFNRDMQVLPLFLPDVTPACENPPPSVCSVADRPFFLFVGRLEHIKGLQDVIPLFDDDGPADLWIAGSGNYESELRQLAGNRRCVRFLGAQTQEQLRKLYRRALAVVLPSICYEVFPMVTLEAFREGTPIVARRLGPYLEIVTQSQGGLLFETRDELAHALSLLTHDDDLRTKLGQAGYQAFQSNWHEAVFLERYFALIQRIARERQLGHILDKIAGCDDKTIYADDESQREDYEHEPERRRQKLESEQQQ